MQGEPRHEKFVSKRYFGGQGDRPDKVEICLKEGQDAPAAQALKISRRQLSLSGGALLSQSEDRAAGIVRIL
eukprot:scaffold10127_cov152-Isochrysis_galbana.AAC.2